MHVEILGDRPPPKGDPVFELKELHDTLKYAYLDVTLSGAFNAPCQPAELGMIELFAIISMHNDCFATLMTP